MDEVKKLKIVWLRNLFPPSCIATLVKSPAQPRASEQHKFSPTQLGTFPQFAKFFPPSVQKCMNKLKIVCFGINYKFEN